MLGSRGALSENDCHFDILYQGYNRYVTLNLGYGLRINQNMALGLDDWNTTLYTWFNELYDFEWGNPNPPRHNYSHVRTFSL